MDITAALASLDALSHETRLWAFRVLVTAGPDGLPAGDIAERLSLRQNTLSTHLKHLSAAGLLVSRREGRRIVYAANYETVKKLVIFLMEDCCAGNPAVCRPVARSLSGAH